MGHPPLERCGVYTRYSSDLQRPSSTEDQIRQCRTAGEEQRWAVLDKFIRSDSEITGQSLVGRNGLDELVRLAKTSPRPFDGIIIDDTSRLGRYVPDVLNNFVDQQHIIALPYADHFLTDDRKLRSLITRISTKLPFHAATLMKKAEFDNWYL
jgi:hypothetical protein